MSSFDVVHDMDPAARAVAEVRAREAGISVSQWLEALVYERAASAPVRRQYWYGGGPALRSDHRLGSPPASTSVRAGDNYDSDAVAYVPALRYGDVGTTNLDRIWLSSKTHEDAWSALQMISAFPPRISHAAILLSAAFAEADVAFRLPAHRPSVRYRAATRWYHLLVDTCLHRSREVRNALVHHWTPTGRAEQLLGDAFYTLCDLTPARRELLVLFHHDRRRASAELAKHIELATQQFELSANLLTEVEEPTADEVSDDHRFRQLRAELLEKAGGGVSLTQGADRLGVTRQALHKRIKSGSALGMMDGEELVLPQLQFVISGEKTKLVKGLSDVLVLFDRAGGWSVLQFLIERDPNLGDTPIAVLRAGNVAAVVTAARAYLGLDEE